MPVLLLHSLLFFGIGSFYAFGFKPIGGYVVGSNHYVVVIHNIYGGSPSLALLAIVVVTYYATKLHIY